MAETNILRTALEIDEGRYKSDLQSQYVQPSQKAADDTAAAFKQSGTKIVNAGRESLDRIKAYSAETNSTIKPTFAENYKRAFDDIAKRAELARQSENNVRCSNKKCRHVLAKTDGIHIKPENEQVFSKLSVYKKKRFNPLYCVHCYQITRWYGRFNFVNNQ